MSERPIIFSAPMVRALLDGRKTQTRRILKPQPAQWQAMVIDITPPFFNEEEGGWGQVETIWSGPLVPGMCEPEREEWSPLRLPYAAGDRLWVREACRAEETPNGIDGVRYAADDAWRVIENTPEASDAWVALYHYRSRGKNGRGNPVPSIHMPRWASRITLAVTEVRVQRLQEISEEDARAEGMIYELPTEDDLQWAKDNEYEMGPDDGVWIAPGTRKGWGMSKEDRAQPQWGPTAAFAFRMVWENIHGPDAWAANPWCCCITFKRVK